MPVARRLCRATQPPCIAAGQQKHGHHDRNFSHEASINPEACSAPSPGMRNQREPRILLPSPEPWCSRCPCQSKAFLAIATTHASHKGRCSSMISTQAIAAARHRAQTTAVMYLVTTPPPPPPLVNSSTITMQATAAKRLSVCCHVRTMGPRPSDSACPEQGKTPGSCLRA